MQNDFEIQAVQRLDVLRHERVRIERERTVAGVPAVRAVTRAQINQRVTRKVLLPERARDLERLLRPGKCAMRLEVSKRPFRRQHRPTRQPVVLRQSIGRFLDVDHKQIQRHFAISLLIRYKTPLACAQIKLPFGPMREQRPAVRANEVWRHDRPEHRPVPSAPTRLHLVKRATPIKLLRALAEAQHGSVGVKRDCGVRRCVVIKGQFLHRLSVPAPHRHGQWLCFDGHMEPARAKLLRAWQLARSQLFRGRERHKHGGRCRRTRMPLFIEREQLDPQCPSADFAEDELRVLSSETNGSGKRERPSRQ